MRESGWLRHARATAPAFHNDIATVASMAASKVLHLLQRRRRKPEGAKYADLPERLENRRSLSLAHVVSTVRKTVSSKW